MPTKYLDRAYQGFIANTRGNIHIGPRVEPKGLCRYYRMYWRWSPPVGMVWVVCIIAAWCTSQLDAAVCTPCANQLTKSEHCSSCAHTLLMIFHWISCVLSALWCSSMNIYLSVPLICMASMIQKVALWLGVRLMCFKIYLPQCSLKHPIIPTCVSNYSHNILKPPLATK